MERDEYNTRSKTFNVRMMAPVARSANATAKTSDCTTNMPIRNKFKKITHQPLPWNITRNGFLDKIVA